MTRNIQFSYRRVRNSFVVYRIREGTWVRWFREKHMAHRWTCLVNSGMPTNYTGREPEWRDTCNESVLRATPEPRGS